MDRTLERIKQYTALWREANALYEDWARRRGLSYCELLVILALAEAEQGCTQKEICRAWQLPKQTVNSILKSLVEQELVELSPAAEDRRNKIICLTAPGREKLGRIAADLQAHECTVWRRLGDEQGDRMIEAMRRYNQFFEEGADESP